MFFLKNQPMDKTELSKIDTSVSWVEFNVPVILATCRNHSNGLNVHEKMPREDQYCHSFI
jgi:hypothetical protein